MEHSNRLRRKRNMGEMTEKLIEASLELQLLPPV
jgi:hypothetical protein